MTDGEGLLAAVLANPADDTPRLVYADYLDEQDTTAACRSCRGGDFAATWEIAINAIDRKCPTCSGRGYVTSSAAARAEFIRVQVELGRGPDGYLKAIDIYDPDERAKWLGKVCRLDRQATALSAMHGDSWVPAGLRGKVMWRWERGFVSEIRNIDANDWIEHAADIIATHPVRLVKWTNWPHTRTVNEWEIGKLGRTRQFGFYQSVGEMALDRWPRIRFEFPSTE